MRPSRQLLKAISSSSGGNLNNGSNAGGYLIKPQNNWNTLTSAAHSISSILFSQTKRDSFVETVNKGIINPSVLGQADLGLAKSLALHHDLNSRLWKTNQDFCVEQFLEGAEPALEQFQEVLYSLDRHVMKHIVNDLKLDQNENSDEKDDEDHNFKKIEQIINNRGDWMLEAEDGSSNDSDDPSDSKDADSNLYKQLQVMTSSDLFQSCQDQFLTSTLHCYLHETPRMEYILESGEVKNIALLSARAHKIIPKQDDDHENDSDKDDDKHVNSMKDEVMQDDSLTNSNELDDDNDDVGKYPIAAQIEVVYSISQTFKRKSITSMVNEFDTDDTQASINEKVDTIEQGKNEMTKMSGDNAEESDNSNSNDGDKDSTDQTHELDTAWVAVFEGYLSSGSENTDENDKQSLSWKLMDNRPAWEFPGFGLAR